MCIMTGHMERYPFGICQRRKGRMQKHQNVTNWVENKLALAIKGEKKVSKKRSNLKDNSSSHRMTKSS